MSNGQMPAPGKIKLIKFPPAGQEKTSNARGMPGGRDVEASIWLIHYTDVNSFRSRLWLSVTGNLPLQLNCSYPGKWFTIKSVSKKNDAGGWQKVPAAVSVTENVCKTTRVQGNGSYCTVRGKITGITASDEIKVEYFCWEIGKIWTHSSSLFIKHIAIFEWDGFSANRWEHPMVISLYPRSLGGIVPVTWLYRACFRGSSTLSWAFMSLALCFALLDMTTKQHRSSKPRDQPVCQFSEIILWDVSLMGPTELERYPTSSLARKKLTAPFLVFLTEVSSSYSRVSSPPLPPPPRGEGGVSALETRLPLAVCSIVFQKII